MPFQRIGQRGADEPGGILQYVGDGASGEFFGVVPGQDEVRQEDAVALALDDAAGFRSR